MGLEQTVHLIRVRVRVRTMFLSDDHPGIELGLTAFVTSRRYRQTNSAQALNIKLGLGSGLGLDWV